jgi:hypothetical protein
VGGRGGPHGSHSLAGAGTSAASHEPVLLPTWSLRRDLVANVPECRRAAALLGPATRPRRDVGMENYTGSDKVILSKWKLNTGRVCRP